jgi:hypothetical protein
VLNALVTHLPAEQVQRQLEYLRAVSPASRFVVCHGGRREHFDRIDHDEKLFVEDPSLRGHWRDQSYNEFLTLVFDRFIDGDASVEALFVLEYDQIVLREGFERALATLLEAAGADYLGKNCVRRDASNWIHSIRARRERRFPAYLRGISVRGEREPSIYGGLGGGFVVRRGALEAFRALDHAEGVYLEVYMPSVLHHLGFAVDDVDRVSDLYEHVVHGPVKSFEEVVDAKRRGHFFAHPFKDIERLGDVLSAPGPGGQPRVPR